MVGIFEQSVTKGIESGVSVGRIMADDNPSRTHSRASVRGPAIMTLNVAHYSCSASILTLLKGANTAIECRTFEPEGAQCIRKAAKRCRAL